MDIGQSLNSRDSFPGRKFKNRAPTSCSPGPVLSPPTITFELHVKTAEEIDLEKCTFRNFGSSVTLTLNRVEVTLVCIHGQGLPTHQITWKSEMSSIVSTVASVCVCVCTRVTEDCALQRFQIIRLLRVATTLAGVGGGRSKAVSL